MSKVTGLYKQIYNLAHINRYSIVPRIRNESVAEHSFFVASIVIMLHDEYEFDVGKATTMAVLHDWTESWVDDITVKTKRDFPGIARALKEAEHCIVLDYFPSSAKYYWRELHQNNTTVEAKIVKYADTIQVLQYAQNEILMGNEGYMRDIYKLADLNANLLKTELKQYRRAK